MHTCIKCNGIYKLQGSSHIGYAIKLDGYCTLFCADKPIDHYIVVTRLFTDSYFIINKDTHEK